MLFSATGWHNPPGMGGCHTQIHLIPRDMALDAKGRVTFSPLPEIASTLRVPHVVEFCPTKHGAAKVGPGQVCALEDGALELRACALVRSRVVPCLHSRDSCAL